MHTITLLVGDFDTERNVLPVQFVPNDGLSVELKLSALRVAENIVISQIVAEAEQRGRDAQLETDEQETDDTE